MSNYGYKRTVVGAHYGLRDWLSQRVTAALMILFTLALLLQVVLSPARLGRYAQHLDGLHQARGTALGTASLHHRLARRLRRLGLPGSVASVMPTPNSANKG